MSLLFSFFLIIIIYLFVYLFIYFMFYMEWYYPYDYFADQSWLILTACHNRQPPLWYSCKGHVNNGMSRVNAHDKAVC